MSRDHIIPKFILKGFSKNPDAKVQKITILDTKTLTTEVQKIDDAFTIKDFNTKEIEKLLAYQFEDGVAKIFQKIKQSVKDGLDRIILNNNEYKLLFRFFVVMWRRNDSRVDDLKKAADEIETIIISSFGSENYEKMKNIGYNNLSLRDYAVSKREIRDKFYEDIITKTTDKDETVKKTIENYELMIYYNTSKAHFILHNIYGTMVRFDRSADWDKPDLFIEPIANNLCFLLARSANKKIIEGNDFDIPIETIDNDEMTKITFIGTSVIPNATHIVVDETNIDFVKEIIKKQHSSTVNGNKSNN